jgi:cytochrome P450
MTLFFAAYEDPANALAWAWYSLARNPLVEQCLRTELAEVLSGRPPTLPDLARLPYTTMVIDETLRLYPPTWGILRDVVADDEIGGYLIPAGSSVFIDSYLTHRLPTHWPNPEQFDPSRFVPELTANRPRYAYLPFGGGPRQCIGNALAMMEMQIALAMLTQAFHFQLAPGFTVKLDARNSLRPHPGMWVRLQT